MVRFFFSSFAALNVTQFIVTLIDSIFRLIVVYSLIDLLGEDRNNQILSLSATLFVAPFLLFSILSGALGDRLSKRNMIVFTSWLEFIFMIIAFFALWNNHQITSYFALFLIAIQAAFFTPIKYAIIPEIVPSTKIAKVNGQMVFFTYLAVLVGTFLASFLSDVTNRNFPLIVLLCAIISFIGAIASHRIEKTPSRNPSKKIDLFFFKQIRKSIHVARDHKHLNLAIFSSAFFLYIASYTQLNLIPFGMESLDISDVQTGYVYVAAAIGLGFGSFLVSVISTNRVKLWLSLWGGFGTALSYILLYVFQYNLPIACILFFSIGMHGGLYVVPLDSYVQFISPEQERASLVAVSTFMSYLAVLCGAGTLFLFGEILKITAAQGFLTIGSFTLLMAIFVTFTLRDKQKK